MFCTAIGSGVAIDDVVAVVETDKVIYTAIKSELLFVSSGLRRFVDNIISLQVCYPQLTTVNQVSVDIRSPEAVEQLT